MSLKDEAQAYKESNNGAIGLWPNPPENSTDNPLLISGEYLILLDEKDQNTEFNWWIDLLKKHELEPGLYSRQIDVVSTTSQDELIAIVSACYEIGAVQTLKNIYEYGKSHFWFWNTQYPEIKGTFHLIWKALTGHDVRRSFMGRFPGLIATVKIAAGYKANWLDIWLAKQAFKGNIKEAKGETSGKKLLYLMKLVLKGYNNGLDEVINEWENKMKDLYGENYIAGIYEIWYNDSNHPIRKYARSKL